MFKLSMRSLISLSLFLVPFLIHAKVDMVIYLSDDHSQFDTSLYGNKNIKTPQMEKLASQGMTFHHAYVASPSCAPSRAALLTGLMPARNGAEDNHSYPRPEIPSLIEILNRLGYETAAIGKVAHGKSVQRYGFDHVSRGSSYQAVKKATKDFLQKRSSEKPLCLFVGISNPHVPWPMENSVDAASVEFPPHHLDTPSTRQHRAAYYQEIIELDKLIGELKLMTDKALKEPYLFIHTSDHGSQWPFGKWNLYDYGTRVPFIASWPGVIKPDTHTKAMISWVDILPTLIEAAGGSIPENLDGRSVLPVLKGDSKNHRPRIFTTHTGDKSMNVYPTRAVRDHKWKLIHNLHPEFAFTNHSDLHQKVGAGAFWPEWVALSKTDTGAKEIETRYYKRPEWELYHLETDKWELKNLASDPIHKKRLQQMQLTLEDWIESQGDQLPVANTPRLLSDRSSWDPDLFDERPSKK